MSYTLKSAKLERLANYRALAKYVENAEVVGNRAGLKEMLEYIETMGLE